ncbi:hypothetical protein Pfo_009775 [Paulownia fortunei]|nr:hypothetical protein Pfo_009775 [Paulownia fortunei]
MQGMSRALFLCPFSSFKPITALPKVKLSATATRNVGIPVGSLVVKPPALRTYDLKAVIRLALSEDAGGRAHFLAKEDGIVAGIALAEVVRKDGDSVHKGLQFGKLHGRAHSIVAERMFLTFCNAAHPAYVLETRNTAPALREVDDWVVFF